MTPAQRAVALRLAKWHQAMADEPNRNGAKKEKHAITADILRELAADSTHEPDGWLEAAVAWEVCASIHQTWAKGKDALFTTRHADFVRHADDARRKHAAVSANRSNGEAP